MPIPKIVHYCWFGKGEKPEDLKKYIKSWAKILPDYQVIEWNESNVDLEISQYVIEANRQKRFVFLSDYFRLWALYKYGGIYLDTDVEVKKNLDEFLSHDMFCGFIFNCSLSTAVMGARKNHPVIKELLNEIYEKPEVAFSVNNELYTRFFLKHFDDFRLNGKFQVLKNNIVIYPKEYFEIPAMNKNKDYTVHHCKGAWYKRNFTTLRKIIKIILGELIYYRLSHYRALKKSPLYKTYLEHSKK